MTKCLPHLENQAERDTAIKDIVGFGVSMCALLGFPIGLVGDRMGPKITCSIAMTCQAVGFYLLAFGMTPLWMSVGAFALGIGYQAIRNCHLFVAVYFPTRTAFVMSILATGMCVSLYVPYLMLHATRLVRVEIVVGTYLLLIVIPVAVGDVLLTPFVRPTRADLEKDDEEPEEHKELLSAEEGKPAEFPEPSASSKKPPVKAPRYHTMPLSKQALSFHFLVYLPIFVLSYCRKKHYAQNIRGQITELFGETTARDALIEFYCSTNPLAFIGSAVSGYVADSIGIPLVLILVQALTIPAAYLCTLSTSWLQIPAFIIIIFSNGCVYSSSYAFIAMTYGMANLAALQGIMATTAGVFSLLMDRFWNRVVIRSWFLGSYVYVGYFVVFCGCLATALLGLIILFPAEKDKRADAAMRVSAISRASVFSVATPVFDRMSMDQIESDIARARKKDNLD